MGNLIRAITKRNNKISIVVFDRYSGILNTTNAIGTIESPHSGKILSIRAKTENGSCDVTIKREGLVVCTLSASSVGNTTETLSNNILTLFDNITVDTSNANGNGLYLIIEVEGV